MGKPPEQGQMMNRRLPWKWETFVLAEKGEAVCSKLSSSESRNGLCGSYHILYSTAGQLGTVWVLIAPLPPILHDSQSCPSYDTSIHQELPLREVEQSARELETMMGVPVHQREGEQRLI